jgi:hypothetical protein
LTRVSGLAIAATALLLLSGAEPTTLAQSGCGSVNAIVCENQQPGAPASEWDVSGAGDSSLQGFATAFSIAPGQTQVFKIDTTASAYSMAIYRMGYYGGNGARLVASIGAGATLAQNQPACLTQSTTGLIDCGNWAPSASWQVPAGAVSGIYFAKLTRADTGGSSHIFFVVRDDTRGADILFQTSDTTWQAYNTYGGNSLYEGGPGTNPGRAYKVSYNRPFNTRGHSPQDWVFNAEYPMVRWLERNGYDVSYVSGIDAERAGAELLEHKVFMSVGHDEYWSAGQRANVEAARDAGVHLAFFSGNEVFWKTRWEPSIDGSNTPFRTLVSYKETHANASIDPADPPTWTGTWRDARFSPPADGGNPEHALTGQLFRVNDGNTSAITVPAALGKLRFWRDTSVATLAAGGVATLPNGTLGYEWDEAPNDAFTPRGLIRLSSTTRNVNSMLLDNGSTYGPGTAVHNLTLYRHSSGALVFGAGTVQWSWGLDANHDRGNLAADARMKQATANLLADMNVQAETLEATLVPPTPSNDAIAPTTTIAAPAAGATIAAGTAVTISGTASDVDGLVAGVEVSVDGGTTWLTATGTTTWSYTWMASGSGTVNIRSRGFDDSGNFETPSAGITITVPAAGACPCTIWAPTAVPADPDDNDPASVELGTRFRSDVDGYITGVRFYKAPLNTGTHTGRLWTNTGTLLGTVTFTNETASGWQQANFASAVPITANTTYVVSYHAPNGHYTGSDNYFATTGLDRPPLHALRDGVDGPNGVYQYSGGGVFPTGTYLSESYWVDVVFSTVPPPDATAPTVTSVTPPNNSSALDPATVATATFSEAMDAATIGGSTFELRNPSNAVVPATVSYNSTTRTATLQPASPLALATTYTARIKGGTADPRVKDLAGNALAADMTWSFTTAAAPPPPVQCPCSIWPATTVPQSITDNDNNAVELGTRFRSSVPGYITGARFYKGPLNTGIHVAKLWTSTGTLLGSATFFNETASGWQETTFDPAIPIAANTSYIISYFASNGFYSSQTRYLENAGVTSGPLTAPQDGVDGPNGVYNYFSSGFPASTFNSGAYFVDVVFNTTLGPDVTPPSVTSTTPANGSFGVSEATTVTAAFSEAMDAATINTSTVLLHDPSQNVVPAAVSYSSSTRVVTLTPSAPLAFSTLYTAVVKGGSTDPRVKDAAGNAPASDIAWSFTTAAAPPPPPIEGPGGPILVISSTANPFSTYYAEILRTEGANAFATASLSTVTATTLTAYDTVILGEVALTAAQVTMLTDWVNAGGTLIAMKPDKQLAGLLGLADASSTLANGYLLVNTGAGPGAGIVNETIQFKGVADLYTLNGATAVATLYSSASTPTSFPAVSMRGVGANGGEAIAFTFDLARSVVYTRQGNPAWSGQERDQLPPIRSDDLFFGARPGDVQPDWVDFNKIQIPQADEQQRLLWNLILQSSRKPMPRFWYFPRGLKAVVVMTGDDHGNAGTVGRFDQYLSLSTPGCSVDDWECIRGTSYVFPSTQLTAAEVQNYVAQGFEIALHVNTNCGDFTAATIANFFSTQLTQFATSFPNAPAPKTNRTHCIAWSDYTSQVTTSLSHGIRLDTNYYYWPGSWVLDRPGLFTGSGMPMRFATTGGTMIDVYQAPTQWTDESAQSYPQHANVLLDNALGPKGYYGAFVANMHTDFNPSAGSQGSDAIIASAVARGVPVITARQMLTWLDGRNGSSFGSIAWSNNVLSFDLTAGAGATGLQAMVPARAGNSDLASIAVNGNQVTHSLQTIKGISYAVFAAQPGSYEVRYGAGSLPSLSITDGSANEGDAGVSNASFAVTLSAPSAVSVTVNFATVSGTATADSDFVATSGPLTFAPGVTSQTITVPVIGDLLNETNEQFTIALSGATNATISKATGAWQILNEDPVPSISVADVEVTEGNTGNVNAAFTLTLSAASGRTVNANYATANGSATAGSDYVATSGTATFAAGATSVVVNVPVTGDSLHEPDESFVLNLSAPVDATLARSQATGLIRNDEAAPALSISDVSLAEGQAGTASATFNVTLSAASSQTITASYATANGTAVAGSDYTTASGSLTFAPGVTSLNVTVSVLGDTTHEPNEQFVVNVSNVVNAPVTKGQGIATIVNDDPQPAISVADVSVTEGNTGSTTAAFSLTLSNASSSGVSVNYATANGTATAGSDYVTASGTATFAPGATTATVNVVVNGDTVPENLETFVLDLSGPVNGTVARAQATASIVDDEPASSLSIANVSLLEGHSGTVNAVFTVTLAPATDRTVTVGYTTANGTATAGSDYTATTGTLTFAPGVTAQTIAVPVTGDTQFEGDETFTVTLSGASGGVIATPQAVGTIGNDDNPPSISVSNISVIEGNSGTKTAAFALTLSSASASTVTVAYATADGSATAGSDYVQTAGTATFAPGVTAATVNVTIAGDLLFETDEAFTLNLSAPSNATIAQAAATGLIGNDDAPPALGIGDVTINEGNSGTVTATLTVTLAPVSGLPVTVNYLTADGTATAGSDYTAASGTLTFAPGVTSQTVVTSITPDTADEPNETINVNLSGAVNATVQDAQGVITLTNDDGVIAGLVAAYGFEEGAGASTADSSGRNNNGTIAGATWTAAGHSGAALSFDGVNDMVSIPDNASLDVTRITMMAWVRPTTLSGWRTALLKEHNNDMAYALYAHDNAPKPAGYINISNRHRFADGTGALPLNTWSHLAMTYDGAQMRLYVNGVLVRTRAQTGNIVLGNGALRIGGNQVWGEWFAGQIDDVRIFSRGLTQAEVQSAMNTPVQ